MKPLTGTSASGSSSAATAAAPASAPAPPPPRPPLGPLPLLGRDRPRRLGRGDGVLDPRLRLRGLRARLGADGGGGGAGGGGRLGDARPLAPRVAGGGASDG